MVLIGSSSGVPGVKTRPLCTPTRIFRNDQIRGTIFTIEAPSRSRPFRRSSLSRRARITERSLFREHIASNEDRPVFRGKA
jgi:hypothetical protein